MRSIPKCFRRLHLSVKPYGRSRPYGSSLPSQYNASCAGRESRAPACKHKPLSDFTVAVEQALKWLTGAKRLKLRVRIFLKDCDSCRGRSSLMRAITRPGASDGLGQNFLCVLRRAGLTVRIHFGEIFPQLRRRFLPPLIGKRCGFDGADLHPPGRGVPEGFQWRPSGRGRDLWRCES